MTSIRPISSATALVAAGLASVVLSASPAVAAGKPVASGPLRISDVPAAGDTLQCIVVNVGNADVEVAITSIIEDLEVVPPQVLAPGERASGFNVNSGPGARNGHCRFNVVDGNQKHIQASACALDQNDNCRAVLPAY